MQFSQAYGLEDVEGAEWFDPVLNLDTRLFVDPFLVFQDERAAWRDAHDQVIHHFNVGFELIAESRARRGDLRYQKALAMLQFREPSEFCLGYTGEGVEGAGGGRGYAELIAEAMAEAIQRGLQDLRHFEELGILQEGIGPDRISDITCNILKERFIRYTQMMCRRFEVPLESHRVQNARFNYGTLRWENHDVPLPTNPYTNSPVLLVPQRFLRTLHVLNRDDWWDWYQAERLRDDVNYEVMTHVRKSVIVEIARRNADFVRRWVEQREAQPAAPYDLETDPELVWRWHPATYEYVQQNPLSLHPPTSPPDFMDQVEQIVSRYQRFIEEQGGWRLLWNDDRTEKNEEAAQLTFYGIAQPYCEANDVVVDREVNLGRGPVDFKFSNGYQRRVLLEVKKLTAGRFWAGLEDQLPSYMTSDACHHGWLMAIQLRRGGVSTSRARRLPGEIVRVRRATGLDLRYSLVDATEKPSASRL